MDFLHLFRIVCQAVDSQNYELLLDDCEALLNSGILLGDDTSRVKYCRSILVLARTALVYDPRQLAGQILGRVGIPPFDEDQQHFVNEANNWLLKARSHLSILLPVMGLSGLQPAGQSLLQIIPHESTVTCLAISTDGGKFFTGCENGMAYIYSATGSATGKQLHVLEGHSGEIRAIAVSSDGKKVFTGSYDNTARIWDVETGKEVDFKECSDIARESGNVPAPRDGCIVFGSIGFTEDHPPSVELYRIGGLIYGIKGRGVGVPVVWRDV
jgi:hypothetical protein